MSKPALSTDILATRHNSTLRSRAFARIRLGFVQFRNLLERASGLGVRAMRTWRQQGLVAVLRRASEMFWHGQERTRTQDLKADERRYAEWLSQNAVTDRMRELIREDILRLEYKPKFSIVMPVFNPPLQFLRQAVQSVRAQLYEDWELCICDDGSVPRVAEELARLTHLDSRIHVVRSSTNVGISEATNQALGLATGEFIGLLDHDDLLVETALYHVAKALDQNHTLDVIYTDKDHVLENGRRVDPYFKPDWSPHTILSHNYMIHFLVFRRALLQQIGMLRKEYDGAQDYDLVLRLTEKTNRIEHISKILYSWRKHGGSNSMNPKPSAFEAGRLALEDAMRRRGLQATVERGMPIGPYKVFYALDDNPLVSIIISSRTVELLDKCSRSIRAKTTYANYELMVATNAIGNADLEAYCAQNNMRLVEVVDGFFSKMNNAAVALAEGPYIVILNDDTEVVTPRWIEELLSLCQQPDVVAVGPKLVLADGGIQFTRMVLGIRGDGVPYFFDPMAMRAPNLGPFFGFSSEVISDVTAVCGACMMVKKADFLESGAFDEQQFNICWQDMDWCIRERKRGGSILYTPYAVLVHYGSSTKQETPLLFAKDVEQANAFYRTHKHWLCHGDPFYNPNLADVYGLVQAPHFPGLEQLDLSDSLHERRHAEKFLD